MPNIFQSVRPIKLSLDQSETLRDEFNAQYILNVRYNLNINQATDVGNALTQGSAGAGTPTQSNELLCDITLPEGNNICIGAFNSVKTQELYFNVWNSQDNHSIWVHGTETGTCRKVYEGACLGFRFEPQYHIPDHRAALFVVYDNEDGERVIKNKYYVFTDGYNWQFLIDVESAIATDSYNPITYPYFDTLYPYCDPCEFIQVGIRPPYTCPQVLPSDDDTQLQYYAPEPEGNNLLKKVWYFATSFIDVFGRHSVLSPYSTAAFVGGGDCNGVGVNQKCFKLVLDAGSPFVDKIVIYFSNDGINWFIYEIIDKWQNCESPLIVNFWERDLALRNYFVPIEDSPIPSTCPSDGQFVTSTYTWDFNLSPEVHLNHQLFTIVINGTEYNYTTSASGSLEELVEVFSLLGFDPFFLIGETINVSSDSNVYGAITVQNSPDYDIDPTIDSSVTETGVANTFIYQFCGNKQCIPVDPAEVARYFDDLPIASQSQVVVDDRVAYGDNLTGYDNFNCPLENIIVQAVQDDQQCETDLVTIIIDAVIQNFYTETNEPVWVPDPSAPTQVAFGGLGDLSVGGIDYENEVISTYKQQIVNAKQNFIMRLRGTPFTAIGVQYKIGTDDPVGVQEPLNSDNSRRNMMVSAYSGAFYYQRFTFKVPKGNYIAQLDNHLADGIADSQYTSGYFYGIVPKTSYNPDGTIPVDNTEREVRFSACSDFTYDHYIVIADLTKPKASLSAKGDAKAFCGYLKEDDTNLPIELAHVVATDCTTSTKSITVCTPSTDHNGFFFGTDGGSDYCVNVTIVNPDGCGLTSPTTGINQVNVNSKTLVEHDIIATEPTNFISCGHEIVSGTITDCDGVPIPGVSVVLSYTGRYGITDANGVYRIIAHDSAFWKATLGQFRKQVNIDNLFIPPVGICLYNTCDGCDTCIDVTHVNWSNACFGCVSNPPPVVRTDTYDFVLEVISGALTGVKTGGNYAVAIIGYDYLDRNNEAQIIDFISVPTIQYNGVFAPYRFTWNITGNLNLPPWVKRIRLAVRGNEYEFLLSWTTNKVEFIDAAGLITSSGIATNIKIYIDGLNDFNTQNFFNTNTTYSFVEGDRIRFITNGDGTPYLTSSNNGLIDLPISSEINGNVLLIPFDPRLTDLEAGATFEIYRTPICTTEPIYWEQCPSIVVKDGEPVTTSGTIPFFDTYWFYRAIPQTDQDGLPTIYIAPHRYEHHSPSDFWGAHLFTTGRGFVRNENGRQTWRLDEIAWSDSLLEDGEINGLGTWRNENKKDYGVQNFGGIVAMIVQRGILWALCENDWFAANIAQNLLQITAQGNVIANPDYFGSAQQKIGGIYGCDLRDTSTVIFKDEWISWVDVRRSAVCFSNYQSVEDISLLDVKGYFTEKLRIIAQKRGDNQFAGTFMYLISCYDPKTHEIIITSFAREEVTGDATFEISTDDPTPQVEDAYSFNGVDTSKGGLQRNTNAPYIAFENALSIQRMWAWGSAYDQYKHVQIAGEQYDMIAAEITALGKDPAEIAFGAALTHPGFSFTVDRLHTNQLAGITKVGYVVNLSTPLIPFIGGTVNWGTITVASVIADFNNFVTLAATYGQTIDHVQIGLENLTAAFKTVFSDGGVTYGKLVELIAPTIMAALPSAKIYLDMHTFDITASWPHWETDTWAQLSAPTKARITGGRQYFQVNTNVTTYAGVLAQASPTRIQSMIDFVADFGIFNEINIQQIEFKANNPFRSTVCEGIFYCAVYINLLKANLDNSNVITDICFQTIHSLAPKWDDGEIAPQYYYVKQISGMFTGDIVEITINNPDIELALGVLDGSNLKVYVVNTSVNDIPNTGLEVDGAFTLDYAASAVWGDSPESESVHTSTDTTVFKKYSITELTFTLEEGLREEDSADDISYVRTLLDYNVRLGETISFNVFGKYWSGNYAFTPEMYASFQSALNGDQLIAFKGGKPYMHHNVNPTALTYCNFFGIQSEPILKMVFNGGKENNTIQKRWLALRMECKEFLWYSDEIYTQTGQLSTLPMAEFELIENYSEAGFLCNIDTIDPIGLMALIDGDSLFGNWIKIRFRIDPDNIAEYFEVLSIQASATNSF